MPSSKNKKKEEKGNILTSSLSCPGATGGKSKGKLAREGAKRVHKTPKAWPLPTHTSFSAWQALY